MKCDLVVCNKMNTIYKLNESTKSYGPAHFSSLIENLVIERFKLNNGNSETFKCFSIEEELIYCVALTVALEVGFRFGFSKYLTQGYDVRAMKELTSVVNFRNFDNSCLNTTLFMPSLNFLQFRLISTLSHYDIAIYNLLSLEGEKIRSISSIAIPCSKNIRSNNKGFEMFEDIKSLSEIFTNVFCKVRNEALQVAGMNKVGIFGLPDELKRIIFFKLTARDFARLCATSKILRNFFKEEITWKHFLLRDFSLVNDEGSSYSAYKSMAHHRPIPRNPFFRFAHDGNISEMSIAFVDQGL